jgi:bla regulator protein BlaR1
MIQAICWVLVHSLWQGVLLALAGGGAILSTKRAAAAVRYRMLCTLLMVFLAGMGLTFVYEWKIVSGSGDGSGGVGVSISWLGVWCSAHAAQIVGVWLIITIVKSIRMAAGWEYMRRMRQEGLSAPAMWVERVDELSRQLGIRRTVKLVESVLVRAPIVIGQLRPIIYIPLGLINHLPASEMEAVLLHELGHIRRYDHVVNMVQQVAECLLFFNPGFLWISSLLREERENCCDDIAIAHTRDRVEFVRALVRFKEHSLRGMALAFPGNKRQLLHRVLRISRRENKTLSGRERLVLLGGCLILMGLLVARAGRPDIKKTKERVEAVGVRSAAAPPVDAAPAGLVSVLRTREQVAQNMEWVEAQLDQLHHRSGKKRRNEQVRDVEQPAANVEQIQAQLEQDEVNQIQEKGNQEEMEVSSQQAERVLAQPAQEKEDAERSRRQAELNRQQAEQDRRQAEWDRQQVLRDQQQAARDRDQAARNREQAERNREQAQKDRLQAERDRQQGERDRQQAEMARQQAEQERAKEELRRMNSEVDGQKSKNN